MFQIESGIPIPKIAGRGRSATTSFPFADLDIGDSFLIPCDVTDKKAVESWRRKVLTARKHWKGLATRTAVMSDGLRVWRVADEFPAA
jgi:hypothetical protein